MTAFMFFASGFLFASLVLLTSMHPVRTTLGSFELRRRQKMKDKRAEDILRREELLAQASILKPPLTAVLLVTLTALIIYPLGLAGGLVASLATGLLYARLARLPFIHKLAMKLYVLSEPRLLRLVSKYEGKLKLIGGRALLEDKPVVLHSREELAHAVETSGFIPEDDKRLLKSALSFKQRTVKEIMIPKKNVATVNDTELLGPLVLDDLHKTGHTIFPVIAAGKVVGLLDSRDHVGLRTQESMHVRSVMHSDVVKISEESALNQTLQVLLEAKQQIVIVVGDDDQMTGLVSLKDVIRALTG